MCITVHLSWESTHNRWFHTQMACNTEKVNFITISVNMVRCSNGVNKCVHLTHIFFTLYPHSRICIHSGCPVTTGPIHYNDVIMSAMTSQITSLTIVYWTYYSGADQRKHQSSASRAFVRGIHWWPVNSPHKRPVTRKLLPFDDVIMFLFLSPQASRLPGRDTAKDSTWNGLRLF